MIDPELQQTYADIIASGVGLPPPKNGLEAIERAALSTPCIASLVSPAEAEMFLLHLALGWDGVPADNAYFREYLKIGRMAKEIYERIPRA